MAKQYDPADVGEAFKQLAGENDRAVIFVGGALLENALEQAILSRLREPQTNAEGDILFSERGILNTFSQKIWAAYFLKIIGPSVREILIWFAPSATRSPRDEIYFVRRHSRNSVSLSRVKRREGQDPQKAPPDLRENFIATVQFFTANLFLRSGDSRAEIAEAYQQSAPNLDR